MDESLGIAITWGALFFAIQYSMRWLRKDRYALLASAAAAVGFGVAWFLVEANLVTGDWRLRLVAVVWVSAILTFTHRFWWPRVRRRIGVQPADPS